MSKITIEIPSGELDLEKDISFGLNYSIDDVKKLEVKNTNYSKTITLAGSKSNNKILGGLFDINADFTFFNPHVKTPAKIVVDSTIVLDGFLRLKKINIDGDMITYNCTVSSVASSFFSDIKDKKIEELDFTHYNHLYNRANIVNSWTNSSEKIYTYPMLYKNSDTYETKDFKPAIYSKAYLKQIVSEAGYKISGSILDSTTEEGQSFDKEIIPFSGEVPAIAESEYTRRKFRVGLPTGGSQTAFGVVTSFTNEDAADGFFDNNNSWNGSTGEWTVDRNGSYKIGYNFTGNVSYETPVTAYQSVYRLNPFSGSTYTYFQHNDVRQVRTRADIYKNGVRLGAGGIHYYNEPTTFSGTVVNNFDISEEISNVNLVVGDVITIQIVNVVIGSNIHTQQWTTNLLDGVTHNPTPATITGVRTLDGGYIYNDCNPTAMTDGDDIDLSVFIPKDYKQTDLVNDIIKRYNGYLSVNPEDSKELLLDTRDSYYAKGSIIDWTNKKDYSKKDTVMLISEIQNKEMLFTYSNGDDDYNKNYTESTNGDVYGQHKISFDNEFTKGVKKISTAFVPTPLIYNSATETCIVPSIPSNETIKGMRVLYHGGLINCLNGKSWTFNHNTGGTNQSSNQLAYNYSGHLDNPLNPQIDLNFGEIPYAYYNEGQTTTNANLYNRYWANYVRQINSGKLITMSFNLNEIDISFIKDNLNTKVYVGNSYFIINKIKDYDCTKNGLTKVELLKLVDGVGFTGEIGNLPFVSGNTGGGSTEIAKMIINNNTDYSERSSIIGTGNIIGAGSHSTMIQGSNNVVGEDLTNVFIIGTDNVEITESNTGYINGVFYRNGIVEQYIESLYANVITLKDNAELVSGAFYKCLDKGVTLQAAGIDLLSPVGTRVMTVVKSDLYNTLDVWKDSIAYAVNDNMIYGGMVWKCHTIGSTGLAPTNFELDSAFYELDISKSLYEDKTFDIVWNEVTASVTRTSDGRGNVVVNNVDGYHEHSDWNDLRMINNITTGFINNDWGVIQNNKCNLLAFNTSFSLGVMEYNVVSGDIRNNSAVEFRTLEIKYNHNAGSISYNDAQDNTNILRNTNNGSINNNLGTNDLDILDNSNNGFINYNRALINVSIHDNVNNGDIGNAGTGYTNRVSDITDTIVNK